MQLKMFLLLSTSALSLLIGCVVAAERGASCRQQIPPGLMRELWSRTTQLIDKLPVGSIITTGVINYKSIINLIATRNESVISLVSVNDR